MGTLHLATILLAVTGSGETVLLDFGATWCGPCQQMEPHVDQLATAGYPVRKIDVDQHQDMAGRYGVQSIPCFVLLVNGQERGRLQGMVSPAQLQQLFTAAGVRPVGSQPALARGQSPDRGFFGGRAQQPQRVARSTPDLSVPRLHVELGSLYSAASTEHAQTFFAPRDRPTAAPANHLAAPPVNPVRQPAQTPVPAPRQSIQPATNDPLIDDLMAVSVRLHVEDPDGTSHGSGTIIDSIAPSNGNQGAALVLTCAHIFRDSNGKGPVRVDIFENGVPRSVTGFLVRYDLDRDVALVSVHTDRTLPAAPLAPKMLQPQKGDRVVSIGCPGGRMPTPLESQVLAVSSFGGVTRIQATGQPEIGRSGGGLFNTAGQVIGVCNFADPTDQAGLYAAIGAAKQVFTDAGLAQIYQNATGGATTASPATAIASAGPRTPSMPKMPGAHTAPSPPALSKRGPAVEPLVPVNNHNTSDAAVASTASPTELICIVRSPDGQTPAEVIVIDKASQALLQRIASERHTSQGTFPTSQRRDQPKRR